MFFLGLVTVFLFNIEWITAIGPGASVLPGLQMRISQAGLDYAAKSAVENFVKQIRGEHIDDQHGKAHVAGGKVDYDITGVVVTSMNEPSTTLTVTPGKGITWSISGASISLTGNWHYHYRWHFVKVSDHGSFDLSAYGVRFSISAKLGVDKNGRPTIFSTGCSSGIDKLKIKFHGGASWLYNIFESNLERAFQHQLVKVMCSAATKSINTHAEEKLAKLKVLTTFGHNMLLDYRLIQAPVFGNGYIESMHKGEVAWHTNPQPSPFQPKPFPDLQHTPRMVYIWGSEYVLNTFAYTAFKHGKIEHNLTRDDRILGPGWKLTTQGRFKDAHSMPKGQGDFLNTTCRSFGSICIGNFIPPVAKKYPNRTLIIDMRTTEPPYLKISPKGIVVGFIGNMVFRLNKTPGTQLYLFESAVTVNMTLNVWVDNATVKGNISNYRSTVKLEKSAIGPVSVAGLRWVLKRAVNRYVIKKLNDLGEKGVPVPNVKQCKLLKPAIGLLDGCILISADVLWTPEINIKKLGK